MIYHLIFTFLLVFCFYLGCLVYYKNPKGRDNKLFLAFSLLLILWLICNYLENEVMMGSTRVIFLYADFVVAPIFGYFVFLFCFSYLEEKVPNKKVNATFLGFSIFAAIIVFFDLVIKNVVLIEGSIRYKEGMLYVLYSLIMLVFCVGGPALLIFKYKRFEGIKKIQTLYVLIGFLLTGIIVSVFNIFLQDMVSIQIFRLGTFSVLFFMAFTAYAIIKHQLFDIRTIIQRGIIYISLIAIIITVYLFTIFILGFLFQQVTNTGIVLVAIIVTIAGIFGVPPLEKYFRKLTDKFFYRDKYDYQSAIYKLSDTLNRNINLVILVEECAQALKDILRVKKVNLILPAEELMLNDKGVITSLDQQIPVGILDCYRESKNIVLINSYLTELTSIDEETRRTILNYNKDNGTEVITIIQLKNILIALLFLGEKLSGDIFSKDDVNLIKTFASQAAVAIEKAQLYSQIKSYSEELEQRVELRTTRIKALQEEQKQMMLEIAHGLQTPLTLISGELEMLAERVKDNEMIRSMERSINRISKFIYDMLRLANIESEYKKYKIEEFNLSDLLDLLVEDLEIITQDKGITLEHQISPNIFIKGDRRKIEELVTNLVGNSTKFMSEEKEKKIRIDLRRTDNNVEMIISDTGIGIDKKYLPNLFKRFYRIDDRGHANTRGTGLGLVICKKIVEKHDGYIVVESEVGKGTKFIVNLPIVS